MENPNNVEEIDSNRNHSTGPRTEEGKRRSSLNAVTHGLFAKQFLLPGESQEQFDALHDGFKNDHDPRGTTEECLVFRLAEIQWRLKRLADLEGLAMQKATATDDLEGKFLHNYGLYSQRLNRDFQSTLKTFAECKAKRLKDHALNFCVASILYKYNQTHNVPWKPADDGFVFSPEVLERSITFFDRVSKANTDKRIFVSKTEMDDFFTKEGL